MRYRWGIWWDAEDCWLEDLYRSLGFETGKTGGQDLLMRKRL